MYVPGSTGANNSLSSVTTSSLNPGGSPASAALSVYDRSTNLVKLSMWSGESTLEEASLSFSSLSLAYVCIRYL